MLHGECGHDSLSSPSCCFIILSGYRLGDTEAVTSQPLPETISNRESNSQQETVSYLDDLHWNNSSYFI